MGRIRYLLADLYFCEKLNELTIPDLISESVENAVLEWSGQSETVQWINSPVQGWSGLCPLINGHLTLMVIPSWEYITMGILSYEKTPDPKNLCEMIVSKLGPSVVSVDSLIRGNHLQN
ncbi:MAG TPA: S-adenosylmethionine decarboxylase [Bacillota bacterium]|nr:S-adenosylmethionine decarboxylase [Bacillota bacterium]